MNNIYIYILKGTTERKECMRTMNEGRRTGYRGLTPASPEVQYVRKNGDQGEQMKGGRRNRSRMQGLRRGAKISG